MTFDLQNVLTALAIITGGVALYFSLKKSPLDIKKQIQDITEAKDKRIIRLEERVSNLEKQLDSQAEIITKLRAENKDLKDWADRLVHQVVELGGKPVPFKPD